MLLIMSLYMHVQDNLTVYPNDTWLEYEVQLVPKGSWDNRIRLETKTITFVKRK